MVREGNLGNKAASQDDNRTKLHSTQRKMSENGENVLRHIYECAT